MDHDAFEVIAAVIDGYKRVEERAARALNTVRGETEMYTRLLSTYAAHSKGLQKAAEAASEVWKATEEGDGAGNTHSIVARMEKAGRYTSEEDEIVVDSAEEGGGGKDEDEDEGEDAYDR